MKKTVVGVIFLTSILLGGDYLGNYSSNPYGANSSNNKYGSGSKYRSNSINNSYGQYGSKYSNNLQIILTQQMHQNFMIHKEITEVS
ncbi:MAG: hypothetical protein ISR68_00460 [Campylobacterales bacterium]|nr:hypothetical protein [Campylobacterales bacterium]